MTEQPPKLILKSKKENGSSETNSREKSGKKDLPRATQIKFIKNIIASTEKHIEETEANEKLGDKKRKSIVLKYQQTLETNKAKLLELENPDGPTVEAGEKITHEKNLEVAKKEEANAKESQPPLEENYTVAKAIEEEERSLNFQRDTEEKQQQIKALREDPLSFFEEKLKRMRRVGTKSPDFQKALGKIKAVIHELVEKEIKEEKKKEQSKDENTSAENITLPSSISSEETLDEKEERERLLTEQQEARRKETAIFYLKKTIEDTRLELEEIEEELAMIRTNKKRQRESIATAPEAKTFSVDFIEKRVRELLKSEGAVKNINSLEIVGRGDTIKIDASITAKKFMISATVNLKDAFLINKGDTIGLKKGYSLSATKLEDKIKSFFSEHIDSIGEKLKEFIESENGKKVKKLWIEDGSLKVIFE